MILYRFPRDPVLADRWIEIVRQSKDEFWWKPYPSSTICSDHFCSEDIYVTKNGLHRVKNGVIPKAKVIPSKVSISISTVEIRPLLVLIA